MAKSACNKVWSVPELRDMILLHLPLRDLIKTQLICSDWANSDQVQAALFQRPYGSSRVEAEGESSDIWNIKKQTTDAEQPLTSQPIINPFMIKFLNPTDNAIFLINITSTIEYKSEGERWYFEHNDERMDREEASWRNMQVLQPAASTITMQCLGNWLHANCWDMRADDFDGPPEDLPVWKHAFENPVHFTVQNPEGITWGQLTDEMDDHHTDCDACQHETDHYCYEYDWYYHGMTGLRKIGSKTTGHQILAEIISTIKNEPKKEEGGSEAVDQDIENDHESIGGETEIESA